MVVLQVCKMNLNYSFMPHPSGIVRQGHTGARAPATGGRAPPTAGALANY